MGRKRIHFDEIKICEFCQEEYVWTARRQNNGAVPKYCSEKCRRTASGKLMSAKGVEAFKNNCKARRIEKAILFLKGEGIEIVKLS